jgi:hypothetical protein
MSLRQPELRLQNGLSIQFLPASPNFFSTARWRTIGRGEPPMSVLPSIVQPRHCDRGRCASIAVDTSPERPEAQRTTHHLWAVVLVAWACVGLANGVRAATLPLAIGDPSVLSQQGQRLKVAVPYEPAPGERVPLLRFSVASVTAPAGQQAPSADTFVVSQPERRNIVYLQSREEVSASTLRLVLAVAGAAPQQIEMNLQIPPTQYATTELEPTKATKKKKKKKAPTTTRRANHGPVQAASRQASVSPAASGTTRSAP